MVPEWSAAINAAVVYHAATGGVDQNRRGLHPFKFRFPR